jgi:long-chain acyl-CoA synthetase
MPNAQSDKPAVTIWPTGQSLTHGQLDELSNQFAHLLLESGNPNEGGIAFLLANQIEYPVTVCGARKAGLDHLPLNTHSPANELLEILRQFQPRVIVVDHRYLEKAAVLREHLVGTRFIVTGALATDWESYDLLMDNQSAAPVEPTSGGRLLLLSGGSTGVPKIVIRPNADRTDTPRNGGALAFLDIEDTSTLLLPAPLYHTMPMGWMVGGLEAGLHVVIMRYWDTKRALEAIQQHRVTFAALVPTMMGRLVELPRDTRDGYDISSLKAIVHGAAPCPTHVKHAVLDWLPETVEVYEAYGSSEGFGMCRLGRNEWLQRPGSVGLPIQGSRVMIRDDDGNELPTGEIGVVWFARPDGARMSYLGRPTETAEVYNRFGEGSSGDMGRLDEDGYLYLTGRRKNMLIVGGVNVFPDQIANLLAAHPAVQDAAVTGVPCSDLGEMPVALVELGAGHIGSPDLIGELTDWCRARACSTSSPRRIIFVNAIPRLETGKLNLRAIPALVR